MAIKKSKDKKILANNIANSTEFIPPSPTASPSSTLYNHYCGKCNLTIACKEMNNQNYLAADAILYNDKPYHKICADT